MAIFNSDLIGDLARQRVVLFIGAGVSSSAHTATGGKILGWPDFLTATADEVAEPLKSQVKQLVASKDYLLACELLQVALEDEWERLVTAEFGQTADPSSLHKAILELSQRITITTNFDKLFETAWGSPGTAGTHYPKVISKIDRDIFRILKDPESSYLLKIHGSVDDPTSLIFSRSEYIRMAFGNENYSTFLDSLLLNFTFIYIGFSMDDPAITSLMEMYALRYPSSRPHYIFAPSNVPENIVQLQKRLRKLVVLQYSGENDHAELAPMLVTLRDLMRDRRKEIIAEDMKAMARI